MNMYRGYLAICHPEEQQLSFIERLVEMASSLAIREWRRLPHVVSHVHTPLLQVRAAPQHEHRPVARCSQAPVSRLSLQTALDGRDETPSPCLVLSHLHSSS